MAQMARTDIGFQGGQVLALRIAEQGYEQLVSAMRDGDASNRWHRLESDEEWIEIDLSEVVYVRRETEGQKVGF
jgi:hypothetical protein